MQGNIQSIKDKNLSDLGFSERELVGKNQSEFAREAKENPEEYQKFWDDLRNGIQRRRLFSTKSKKGQIWISEIYTPITDIAGNYTKVINIGFDITEQKQLEEKLQNLQEDIDKSDEE